MMMNDDRINHCGCKGNWWMDGWIDRSYMFCVKWRFRCRCSCVVVQSNRWASVSLRIFFFFSFCGIDVTTFFVATHAWWRFWIYIYRTHVPWCYLFGDDWGFGLISSFSAVGSIAMDPTVLFVATKNENPGVKERYPLWKERDTIILFESRFEVATSTH